MFEAILFLIEKSSSETFLRRVCNTYLSIKATSKLYSAAVYYIALGIGKYIYKAFSRLKTLEVVFLRP